MKSLYFTPAFPGWLEFIDNKLKTFLLPFGLFIQLTGLLWIGSSGGYVTQTYIWCLFPGLISLAIDIYKYGIRSCLNRMTASEKWMAILFIWILVHPLFVNEGMSFGTVFNRVLKITLYLYVVRTVILHTKKPERLLLIAAGIATFFAAFTMIYQFGVLNLPVGVRALGFEGHRIGSLGIGDFAKDLDNPILAALYYGSFAAILCGYLAAKPFSWLRYVPAIIGLIILGLFILLSGSRGPLVALVIMAGFALVCCQQVRKKKVIVICSMITAVSIFVLRENILLQLNSVIADGFNCRIPIWQRAIQSIIDKPLIGYGAYAQFEAVCRGQVFSHPHNMPLLIFYNWGIIAVLLYLVILINTFKRVNSTDFNSIELISATLLLFGFVGMLSDTYSFLVRPDLQWLLFFLPVAMMAGAVRRKVV